MDIRGLVWKQVKNYILWSEIGLGFGEPGGTPPPIIPRSAPPHPLWERNWDKQGKHSKPVSPLTSSWAPCSGGGGGGPTHWAFKNFQQTPTQKFQFSAISDIPPPPIFYSLIKDIRKIIQNFSHIKYSVSEMTTTLLSHSVFGNETLATFFEKAGEMSDGKRLLTRMQKQKQKFNLFMFGGENYLTENYDTRGK